jgi:pyridoxine 4-dehydrogenase
MQLTWVPNGIPDETTFACLRAAADAGATAWSSATFYGHSPGGGWDNIELLGRFFKKHPEYIGKVTLVIKGGLDVATRTPSNE